MLTAVDLFRKKHSLTNQGRFWLILFTFTGCISILLNLGHISISNISAFAYLFLYYILLNAYDLEQSRENNHKEFKTLILVFTVFSFVFSAISLVLYIIQYTYNFYVDGVSRTIGISGNRLTGMYGNSIDMGFISFFSIMALVITFFFDNCSKKYRKFAITNMVIQFLTLILSVSRGPRLVLYGYVFLLALLFAFGKFRKSVPQKNRKEFKHLGKSILCAVLAIVILFAGITVIKTGLSYLPMGYQFIKNLLTSSHGIIKPIDLDRSLMLGSSGRFELWGFAFRVFREKPLFGVGFLNGGNYAANVLGIKNFLISDITGGWHNVYMEVLTGFGIIGLILFLIYLVKLIRMGIRYLFCVREINKEYYYFSALFSAVLSYLALSVVDYQLICPSSVMATTFWILLGYYTYTIHRIYREYGWEKKSIMQKLLDKLPARCKFSADTIVKAAGE